MKQSPRVWLVGVTPLGRYKPFLESRLEAKRNEAQVYASYDEALKAAEDLQVERNQKELNE